MFDCVLNTPVDTIHRYDAVKKTEFIQTRVKLFESIVKRIKIHVHNHKTIIFT